VVTRLLERRIKLRDLQILSSVAQLGSMAKAASRLSITQPTVSQAIADLEHAVGVRLFDRSTQGVALTGPQVRTAAGSAACFGSRGSHSSTAAREAAITTISQNRVSNPAASPPGRATRPRAR
jgi:hypothetical protein